MKKTCPHCGSSFFTPRRKTIFCNKDCYGASRQGKERPELSAKLDEQIEMIPIAGCWIWMGCVSEDGHGTRRRNGRGIGVHRIAYCEHHGISIESIDGLVVRHKCDNPPCINPNHLELGTHSDNMRDRVERDRTAYGERAGGCKLNAAQIAEIRTAYVYGSKEFGGGALGKRYGVSAAHIWMIVNNQTRLKG